MAAQTVARATTAKIAIVIAVAVAASLTVYLLVRTQLFPPQVPSSIAYGVIILFTGVWLTNIVSDVSLKVLLPKVGNRAYTAANLLKFFGYALVAIGTLAFFGVSPELALAGGTFSGLVIGLGAQPVLGNFFAGIVLLVTGVVKAGDEVRLVSSSLPYQPASGVSYKYFSAENIDLGYHGTVVEVGLLFTTMTTDTGLEFKVPNQLIINSAILGYGHLHSTRRELQVRYEFSVTYDPDLVLERVKGALSDLKQVGRIIINEQSDKQYYIVLIQLEMPIGEEWPVMKSEILKRLVKVHRSFLNTGKPGD